MGRNGGSRGLVGMVVASFLAACVAGRATAADLEIGSPAPKLDIEHWFESDAGAAPIAAFEPGKVYVVEFWATWCGPCVASMPHLAEVAGRFAGKGVTVIGVSDEPVETIEKFRETKSGDTTFGAVTRRYRLATDPDHSVHVGYLDAAGCDGIPTAFIVGRKGEIEWIGHPLDLDEPLAKVVDGTWDRAAHAAAFREANRIDDLFTEASRLFAAGQTQAALDRIDALIAGTKDAAAREQLAADRLHMAIRAAGPRGLDAFRTVLAAAGAAPEQLNEAAWTVVTLAEDGEEPSAELVAAALGVARQAAALAPENGTVLDTLAHLLAMTGDLDAALATQRKAAAHAGDRAAEITGYLRELEQRAAGR